MISLFFKLLPSLYYSSGVGICFKNRDNSHAEFRCAFFIRIYRLTGHHIIYIYVSFVKPIHGESRVKHTKRKWKRKIWHLLPALIHKRSPAHNLNCMCCYSIYTKKGINRLAYIGCIHAFGKKTRRVVFSSKIYISKLHYSPITSNLLPHAWNIKCR